MKLEPIEYNGGVIWVDKEAQITKGDTYVFFNSPKDIELRIDDNDAHGMCSCVKVVAQSPNLSIPNIPYVEVEEDIEQSLINNYKKVVGEELNKHELKLIKWLAASAKKWSDEEVSVYAKWRTGVMPHDAKWIVRQAVLDNVDPEPLLIKYYQSLLQPKIKSIEIDVKLMSTDVLKNCYNKFYYKPTTYQKDGKTFLKVKKINYDMGNNR